MLKSLPEALSNPIILSHLILSCSLKVMLALPVNHLREGKGWHEDSSRGDLP